MNTAPAPAAASGSVFENSHVAVQSIFSTTTCYDLMQQSSKVDMISPGYYLQSPNMMTFITENITGNCV
jgi:hypothetical protein